MATKTKSTVKPPKSHKKTRQKSKEAPATRASRPSRTPRPTAVGRVASTLPRTLRDAKYLKRTIEILDQRQRKADRLKAQTKKELVGVVEDIKGDVSGRIESEREAVKKRVDSVVSRAKKTSIGRTFESVPKKVTKFVDRALDRLGLTRKHVAS